MGHHVTTPATITVAVSGVLRDYCGSAAELPVAASSVRAALAELERDHAALYRSVCDETGAVRRHVNIFVNASHIRELRGLDTRLTPGDIITFLPAVSGG